MRKTRLLKLPEIRSDEDIATFMEEHDGFELIDAGLAEIIPTPDFVHKRQGQKSLLKNRRVRVAFRNEKFLRKIFPSALSSDTVLKVIDADSYGLLLGRADSKKEETFYVPYVNICGIRVL